MYHVGMFVEYVESPRSVIEAIKSLRSETGVGLMHAKNMITNNNNAWFSSDDMCAVMSMARTVTTYINAHGGVARFVEDGSALG